MFSDAPDLLLHARGIPQVRLQLFVCTLHMKIHPHGQDNNIDSPEEGVHQSLRGKTRIFVCQALFESADFDCVPLQGIMTERRQVDSKVFDCKKAGAPIGVVTHLIIDFRIALLSFFDSATGAARASAAS